MACRWPGSSVHGIFQARILELVAVSYSRIFSRSFTVSSEFVSRARRSLAIYRPWGHKESNTTEHAHTDTGMFVYVYRA